MHDVGPFLDRLAAQAHADGGWGYAPDQPAHLEPTCLGLLALSLRPDAHREVFDKAREALDSCAVDDGTYHYQLTASTDEKVPLRSALDDGRNSKPTAMLKGVSVTGHFEVKAGAIVKVDPNAREDVKRQK